MLNVVYAECHYAECHYAVIMLSAVAPSEHPIKVRVNVVQTLGAVFAIPYFLLSL
jgi:hypothetical protein